METTCRNRHRQSMFAPNFHDYSNAKAKSGSADCLATTTAANNKITGTVASSTSTSGVSSLGTNASNSTTTSTGSSTTQAPPPPPSLHCKMCRLAFHTHRALRVSKSVIISINNLLLMLYFYFTVLTMQVGLFQPYVQDRLFQK